MIISDWLNSSEKNYDKGVALFEENGGSAVVLRLLHQGCNSFTSSLLEEELGKLIQSAGAKPARTDDLPKSTSQAPCDTSGISLDKMNKKFEKILQTEDSDSFNKWKEDSEEVGKAAPTALQSLIKERQQLYRERDYMKAKLPHVRGKSRAEYAIRIVTNTYRIDDIWHALDHYEKTGVLIHPDEKKKDSAKDMIKIERNINNARSNISKHKKAGKTELEEKWKAILKALEQEKNDILNAV